MGGINDVKFQPPQGGAARAAFDSFLAPAGGKDGVAAVELEWPKVQKALAEVQRQWGEAMAQSMVTAQQRVLQGQAKPDDPVQVNCTITWGTLLQNLGTWANGAYQPPKIAKPEALKTVTNSVVIMQVYVNALLQKINEGFATGEWENATVRQLQPSAHPGMDQNVPFLQLTATY